MTQLVDPFVPVSKPRHHPAGQYGSQYILKKPAEEPPAPKTPAVADKPAPVRPTVTPLVSARRALKADVSPVHHHIDQPHAPVRTVAPRIEAEKVAPKPRKKLNRRVRPTLKPSLQMVLFIVLAIIAGLLLQSLTAGEIVIALYAVYAVVRHVESRTTFMLALVALISTALVNTFNSDSNMANNFAVYAFLLLVIGTISMGIEIRRDGELSKD